MSKKIISFLLFAFANTIVASAQDTTRTLSEVVVTANKFAVKQSETGKVFTVITQEQLEKNYGKSLTELLNQQVGLSINGATNTPGTNQTIFLRGAAPGNTLILLDGVPLNDASGTSSEFDLNNFSIYNIERIEILKGSQSTLYGSDAVAGVINIITKKSAEKAIKFNATATAGSYDTYKAAFSVTGSIKGLSYHLGYNKLSSNGLSAAYDSSKQDNFENDPFRQQFLQASIGVKLSSKMETRFYGKYNENRTDIDAGAFTDDRDYRLKNRNLIAGTKFIYRLPIGSINFNYNFNWYERFLKDDSGHIGTKTPGSSFYTIFQEGNFKSRSHFAEVYSNLKLQKHAELLVGIDFRKNSTDQSYLSISNYGPFTSMPLSADTIFTKQYSGYASLLVKDLSGIYLEAGGRFNHHSVYGSNITYSLGSSYLIKKFKVFSNLSSGFRAPALYQLYSEYGNKDLQPEESVNAEAGIQYSGNKFRLRVVGFARRIKDVFTFYTDPVTFAGKYINDDLQKDHGFEAEFNYKISGKVNVGANYTWVDGKITTTNAAGKDTSFFNLYRRPAHTINLNAGIKISERFYASTNLLAVNKFYEPVYGGAPIEMKGYYTLNFYTEYNFRKQIRFFADLKNITNQKYFEARGFNSKRFNLDIGLNISL